MNSFQKSLVMLALISSSNNLRPSDHSSNRIIGYYGNLPSGQNVSMYQAKNNNDPRETRRKELLTKIPELNKRLIPLKQDSPEAMELLRVVTDLNRELAKLNRELRSI